MILLGLPFFKSQDPIFYYCLITFSVNQTSEQTRRKQRNDEYNPMKYAVFGVLSLLGLMEIVHATLFLAHKAAFGSPNTF